MNKLQEGAESFKQFVLDEYNQITKELEQTKKQLENSKSLVNLGDNKYRDLQAKYHTLEENKNFINERYLKLQDDQQILSTTYLRLLDKFETERHTSAREELMKKQLAEYAASHTDICKKNIELRDQNNRVIKHNNQLEIDNNALCKQNSNLLKKNFELCKEIADLKETNDKLSQLNTHYTLTNNELINIIEHLGYSVKFRKVDIKEVLKEKLSQKYHVEEVEEPTGRFDIDFLVDMLKKGLGEDFNVTVVGADLAENIKKRDDKGRFSK